MKKNNKTLSLLRASTIRHTYFMTEVLGPPKALSMLPSQHKVVPKINQG